MRNAFQTLVLAAAFALLVPDNRAVGAADLLPLPAATASQGLIAPPAVSERASAADAQQAAPEVSWLLALGFLGVVMARRLRAD